MVEAALNDGRGHSSQGRKSPALLCLTSVTRFSPQTPIPFTLCLQPTPRQGPSLLLELGTLMSSGSPVPITRPGTQKLVTVPGHLPLLEHCLDTSGKLQVGAVPSHRGASRPRE